MTWNPWQGTAALLLLVSLLAPRAALAQEPYRLGGVEPLLNDQKKVVDLLVAKRWQEARSLARQQFLVLAGYADQYPASVAAGLVLEALADAGLGDEGAALCRWEAAQQLDPHFVKADLSPFGAPGALLGSHPLKEPVAGAPEPLKLSEADREKTAKEAREVQKPELLSQSPPQYPPAARKARVEGTVVVESILGKDGSVLKARVLQDQRLGLGLSAVEAVCGWRFKPATLDGKAVKVYYVLTVNFKIQKKPGSSGP